MGYDKDRFLKEQPKIARLFTAARSKNRLGHAYLLFGDPSAPLKETALYLAKSLQCEKDTLACNSCPSCHRFNQGIHPDFLFIDGSQTAIKKADVDGISDRFAFTSLEEKHISSYVINHVENISSEAINALLKTLEEPAGNTVAFLTTDNKSRVLPTILSRCEPIQVESPDLLQVLDDYRGDYDKKEYYIVSNFAYSEEDKAELIEGKEFGLAYESAMDFLNALADDPSSAPFHFMNMAAKELKGSKCYTYFYSIIAMVFVLSSLNEPQGPLKEMAMKLKANFSDKLIKAALLTEEAKNKQAANLSFTLMGARIIRVLEGEKE